MFKNDRRSEKYYEEDDKRESRYRLLSDLERYEIFNTEEAEKYDTQQALDFIIVAAVAGSKLGLFGGREYVEIPWNYITKIGANVIVVSADKDKIKRARA